MEIVHEILNEVDPLVGDLNNTSYLRFLCFSCMKYNLSPHQECHEVLNGKDERFFQVDFSKKNLRSLERNIPNPTQL